MNQDYVFTISVKGSTVIRLYFEDELDLSSGWTYKQAQQLLLGIEQTDVSDILKIIDSSEPYMGVSSNDVPQYGSFSSLLKVPEIIAQKSMISVRYELLGFCLLNDMSASKNANIKYGETHGKGAAHLGLVLLTDDGLRPSVLTVPFVDIKDEEWKSSCVRKMLLRMKVIQNVLRDAKDQRVRVFDYLGDLAQSTKIRRAACLKFISKELRQLNCSELSLRLDNVIWE